MNTLGIFLQSVSDMVFVDFVEIRWQFAAVALDVLSDEIGQKWVPDTVGEP